MRMIQRPTLGRTRLILQRGVCMVVCTRPAAMRVV
jgi:hypothetical protein